MKNSSGGNSKIVTIGGVVVVVLGLLLVGMYSSSLKTMVGLEMSDTSSFGGSAEMGDIERKDCYTKSEREQMRKELDGLEQKARELASEEERLGKKIQEIEEQIRQIEEEGGSAAEVRNLYIQLRPYQTKIDNVVDEIQKLQNYYNELYTLWRHVKQCKEESTPTPTSPVTPSSLPKRPSSTPPANPS